ncbi:MAG TPA: lysylphosphatidylglycerol synthase domain-containing protein, partial [Humidesulfovibrio sp.]|uniref:lysylphosphatidylglycerol synthase domain-containing protein n=1 Tax=Humidesulfovibrio sp. TaxID=2910988 RepID=UPI002C779A5A
SYQAGMQALFPPPQIGCAIMATCMTVFGLVVAPVPSGTGTTHGAIVIALTMFGVDLAQAFAFALLYHALTTGANICLGFASARSLGLKPSTLLKRIRPQEDKP